MGIIQVCFQKPREQTTASWFLPKLRMLKSDLHHQTTHGRPMNNHWIPSTFNSVYLLAFWKTLNTNQCGHQIICHCACASFQQLCLNSQFEIMFCKVMWSHPYFQCHTVINAIIRKFFTESKEYRMRKPTR